MRVKPLIVRKIVKTEIGVDGLGAAIKEAQQKSGKSIESVIREVDISRTYWNNIINEKIDGLSWDLLKKIEKALEWNSDVNF
jgi:hypothetical protein